MLPRLPHCTSSSSSSSFSPLGLELRLRIHTAANGAWCEDGLLGHLPSKRRRRGNHGIRLRRVTTRRSASRHPCTWGRQYIVRWPAVAVRQRWEPSKRPALPVQARPAPRRGHACLDSFLRFNTQGTRGDASSDLR